MSADPWYLRDSLARLRTGCGIRFDGKTYTIYNRFGDLGMCEDPAHALAYYLVQAAFEHQPPARVWPRDMLPVEQEVCDMEDGKLNLVHWSEM